MGITRTEDELATLCRTSSEGGTKADGLVRATKAVLPESNPRKYNDKPDVAVMRLQACLRAGIPCILAVDSWDHWVAAVGTIGLDKVVIADPADEELFLYVTGGELLDRWAYGGKCYYVVVV